MGTEGTFRLIDPLAYLVNNVEELDPEIVKAFKRKDNKAIGEMTQNGDTDFDVFICVNKAWHAFVLCIASSINDPLGFLSDIPQNDPFTVPELVLCWSFELCYENEQLRQYKIKKEFKMMKDIRKRINKSYYIGKFMNMRANAFQFSALRAAPHRYNVLVNDCVEFSKEFCLCLLSYCSNARKLERQVNENIKKATASGLSVETLSRRVRSSAMIGNTFLGGFEASTFFSGRNGSAALIVLILIYPVIVSCVTAAVIIYVLR